MNSRENMGALGTRIANMGQTLMQTAIRTGVAAGVSAAAAHIEEEHQKEAKERTDRASIHPAPAEKLPAFEAAHRRCHLQRQAGQGEGERGKHLGRPGKLHPGRQPLY